MQNAGLDEAQAGIKKSQQPQISRWYYSNGRKWRGTKKPLDVAFSLFSVKEESEKTCLKCNIQIIKIMELSSIT